MSLLLLGEKLTMTAFPNATMYCCNIDCPMCIRASYVLTVHYNSRFCNRSFPLECDCAKSRARQALM